MLTNTNTGNCRTVSVALRFGLYFSIFLLCQVKIPDGKKLDTLDNKYTVLTVVGTLALRSVNNFFLDSYSSAAKIQVDTVFLTFCIQVHTLLLWIRNFNQADFNTIHRLLCVIAS